MIELGMMERLRRGSGAGAFVTLTVEKLVTKEPSGFFNSAVMVLVPRLTPVAMPCLKQDL